MMSGELMTCPDVIRHITGMLLLEATPIVVPSK